ncbi:MAG: hypothetical protein Q8L47_04455 [bacterium]|nr:hypothetical protein [bacterium]
MGFGCTINVSLYTFLMLVWGLVPLEIGRKRKTIFADPMTGKMTMQLNVMKSDNLLQKKNRYLVIRLQGTSDHKDYASAISNGLTNCGKLISRGGQYYDIRLLEIKNSNTCSSGNQDRRE